MKFFGVVQSSRTRKRRKMRRPWEDAFSSSSSLTVGLLFFFLFTIGGGPVVEAAKLWDECEKTGVTGGQSSDISLSCRLRTINSEFDRTNFSEISSGDTIVSLSLECSDVIFYQSSLESEALVHLTRLSSLHIEHCKLSRLDPAVFSGLHQLKNLTIRTYNTAWPALSLEIASGVFKNLEKIEKIDISANNIWTFPDKLFCSNLNLNYLNVSLNRLQDISDLSFRENAPASNLKSSNLPAAPANLPTTATSTTNDENEQNKKSTTNFCNVPLSVLDVSYNRLIVLPSRGLSLAGQLKEVYLQSNEISNVADRALAGLKMLKILNLSDNKIVALPTTTFAETREISEIYLQNNSLSSLPPALFANLDQLVVLDLSHNILQSQWMMTSSGSNNGKNQSNHNSNNSNGAFRGLVRLVLLRLGHNRLTTLSAETFQDLYSLQILNVEHNQISVIDPNTFSSCSNLHTLILSHNKLTTIDATALNGLFVLSTLSLDNNAIGGIHPTAFSNCSSLKDLNLNGNAFTEIPQALQNLTLLKTVDLGENKIGGLDTSSSNGGGFSAARLIGLPNLYGLRLTGNQIVNVSKEALKELPSLKVLNLARNRIQNVEQGAFDSNTNLQAVRLDANYLTDISNLFAQSPNLIWLNISDNHLTWFHYALIPKQLQWLDLHKNSITDLENYFATDDLRLQTLDASFNKISRISASNIPDGIEQLFLNDNLISHVEPHTFYKKSNLSRVDIFANQIETMDLKALQLAPFGVDKMLPEFYIAGNPILCDCNMEWLQRINKLDHLRQHPKVMDLDSVYCKLVYHRDKYFVPLADADNSQFLCNYQTHCFALCHCCDFDFCDCAMTCPHNCTCYHDDTWSANIVDCAVRHHVSIPSRIPMDSTEVYLDGNQFDELTSHVFIGRKNLKVLYLNNSGIGSVQNNSFSGLKRLEVLHLENNFLSELQGYEFEPLESLRELYLQSCQISFIANHSFVNLKRLEVLKLDGNRLSRFAIWTLSLNPYLVEIGLTENPWSCSCDYVAMAAPWIQSNFAKLMDASGINCEKNGRSLSLVYMNGTKCSEITALSGAVEARETSLPPYLPLLGAVMVVFILFGSVLVALCRKRNSLRIWAVSKCPLNSLCYQASLDEDREKLYDAYVAYSVGDEAWVSQILATNLQQQHNGGGGGGHHGGDHQPYRLCLHYKDFPVSSFIADTIVEAVESSKRTIIVLSKNFLQSEWCRFEFKSALHAALRGKKNRLVAVTLGDLPTRDLDPDLRVCLRSATVLSANDKLFWAKLRCALPEPRAASSSVTTTMGGGGGGNHHHHNHHNGNGHTASINNINLNRAPHPPPPHIISQLHSTNSLSLPHHHQQHHHHQNLQNHHHHHPLIGNGHVTSMTMSRTSPSSTLPPPPPPNNPVPLYMPTGGGGVIGHNNNNRPPPFPAPRRPPPPAPLWT